MNQLNFTLESKSKFLNQLSSTIDKQKLEIQEMKAWKILIDKQQSQIDQYSKTHAKAEESIKRMEEIELTSQKLSELYATNKGTRIVAD